MNELAAWTNQRLKAAELTAVGLSAQAVATQTHVSLRTIWRWRADEDFQAAVMGMREERHARIRDKLDKATETAVDVIDQAVDGQPVEDGQVQVAKWLLEGQGLVGESAGANPSKLPPGSSYRLREVLVKLPDDSSDSPTSSSSNSATEPLGTRNGWHARTELSPGPGGSVEGQ